MTWPLKSKGYLLLSFGLGLFSIALRFIALNQSEHPNGWDGYYYVMQVHSWMTYGHLQSLDYSLIYPYFLALTYLIGDLALAFKIGSAILSGAIIIGVYFLILRLSPGKWTPALCSAFLLFSPTVTYFISQFPKNALGLVWLLWFLIALSDKRWWMVAFFAILSFLTHRMTGGMVLVVLVLFWFRQVNWKWIAIGGLSVLLLSMLPGLLHLSDFQRFQGAFTAWPQFAPYSFYRLFQNELSPLWMLELLMISIALIALAFLYFMTGFFKSMEGLQRVILPMLVLLSLFPFFEMTNGSMGYRFFMMAPFFLAILCGTHLKINLRLSGVAVIVLLVGSCFSFRSYDPARHDPPNHVYEVITNRLETYFDAKDYPLVISHKSLAEMIIYKTSFDALNWVPAAEVDEKKTLRIVHNLQYFHFTKYLNEEALEGLQKLTLHYYAITEQSWKFFIERVMAAEDEELLSIIVAGKNPMKERPEYLKKGKNL